MARSGERGRCLPVAAASVMLGWAAAAQVPMSDVVPPARIVVQADTDLPGNDLSMIRQIGQKACVQACLANEGCEELTCNACARLLSQGAAGRAPSLRGRAVGRPDRDGQGRAGAGDRKAGGRALDQRRGSAADDRSGRTACDAVSRGKRQRPSGSAGTCQLCSGPADTHPLAGGGRCGKRRSRGLSRACDSDGPGGGPSPAAIGTASCAARPR